MTVQSKIEPPEKDVNALNFVYSYKNNEPQQTTTKRNGSIRVVTAPMSPLRGLRVN